MKTKVIYFVHGTTNDNINGKCSGWKQAELSDLGKERAIKLGQIKKNTHLDIIFTSDLVRAIDSANLAFPSVKHIQDIRLRECNYGDLDEDYQGKTIGIVAHRAPQLAFEVLTKNISWEEANKTDWRKTKAWQPGWEYIIE